MQPVIVNDNHQKRFCPCKKDDDEDDEDEDEDDDEDEFEEQGEAQGFFDEADAEEEPAIVELNVRTVLPACYDASASAVDSAQLSRKFRTLFSRGHCVLVWSPIKLRHSAKIRPVDHAVLFLH